MLDKKTKQCSLQVKDIDEKQGIVQFYAAAFGNKDSDGDIIVKGSYTKTLSENISRIKHLYNHWKAIGVPQSFQQDNIGLLVTSKIAQTTAGKDAIIEYKDGIITEHSHGFKIIKEDYNEDEKTNYISEMKLWEVSSLDKWGANDKTPMVSMKDYSDAIEQLKAIDKVLRSTNISDEGAIKLLKYSKRINIFLKSLDANKKPGSTTSEAQPIDYNFLTNNFKLQ